jgi:curli biogenesis system outer membrane secretion channel CsgG
VDVDATGTGPTREDAIAQALVDAIQQVTGIAVTSAQQMRVAIAGASGPDGSVAAVAEEAQEETRRESKGIVRSYRVISSDQDKADHYEVHLIVTVEKFQSKGLGNDSRRRIGVAVFGGAPSTRGIGSILRDRINAALTQARRFAVLDRASDLVYAQEMATLANAPVTERVRVGQAIGADYVVVGTIRQAAVSRGDQAIELTDERVRSASSAAEVDFQVVEIATRQIKWADTIRFSADGDALDGLVDGVGARIADEITQTIYPMRLIKFDDPTELIINQGGSSLHSGQHFRAMLLGEMLVDPYTKEPLGQTEREVGVIELQRVEAKVSYAKLISGHLPAAGSEIVLRPAAAVRPAAARPPKPEARPVVKLPGDP